MFFDGLSHAGITIVAESECGTMYLLQRGSDYVYVCDKNPTAETDTEFIIWQSKNKPPRLPT